MCAASVAAKVPIVDLVETERVDQALAAAEKALEEGRDLAGTGFWKAVDTVKGNPELIERHADRIAAIDAAAFRRWALLRVPLWLGTTLMVLATAGALVLIGFAYPLEGLAAVVVFYLGLGVLLVTTHGLAHLVVGSLLGIRFSAWFMGPLSFPPTGGVKIDYGSYLRTPPMHRAWMHAAGAIATKVVPFALIGGAVFAGLPAWAVLVLVGIGLVSVATDIVWSTKKSDWKRFRREARFAG